ncbi:MAG: hypothetical protein WAL50_03595 [Kineosporiaceae bacterium]
MVVDDKHMTRGQLSGARNPVAEPPREPQYHAIQRRRAAVTWVILAAGAAVTATVVLAMSLSTGDDRGSDPVTSAVAADYTGSSWRLTQVQEGAQSTAIPADLGAGMRVFPDGVSPSR